VTNMHDFQVMNAIHRMSACGIVMT